MVSVDQDHLPTTTISLRLSSQKKTNMKIGNFGAKGIKILENFAKAQATPGINVLIPQGWIGGKRKNITDRDKGLHILTNEQNTCDKNLEEP